MSTREAISRRQPCAIHEDRQAVETCGVCGRLVCLDCAIPFRGRVLCREDAARELGDPTPPPDPADRRPRRLELVGAILLGVAVAATIPPWDRFGSLTGVLAAWSPEPEVWPLVSAIGAAVACSVALWLSVRRRRPGWPGVLGWAAASTISAVAAARVIFGAPDYVDHTVAPYVTLVGASGGALLALVRLRRTSARP